MRPFVVVVISAVAIIFSAQLYAVGESTAPISFTMGWHASLAADGQVLRLIPIKNERIDRVPQIRARLEHEIRGWHFLAGTVDGKPEPTETGLYLRATLTETQNDTIRIRVDSAATGATEENQIPPRYPAEAIRAQQTGEVVLRIGYDADGNVNSVAPYADGPKANKLLVDASIKAAKRWKFQPEVVAGHALAGYSIAPFCYFLNYPNSSHKKGKCDWKRPGSDQELPNGEALALKPAAKLLTDVAGRIL